MTQVLEETTQEDRRAGADLPFFWALGGLSATYVLLIVALVAAIVTFRPLELPFWIWDAVRSPEIRYAIGLSLLSCTAATLLSLCVAVPAGYLMSRRHFPGKNLLDAVFDVPIVLPPLVIGLGLLMLFRTPLGRAIEWVIPVTYEVPSVVLAQFVVACAFAVRTMTVTFGQISPRPEQVALTLGCSRARAFFTVALPEARRGIVTAATVAWARALGEFGPILVFSGTTRMRTEVLPSTVFLELSIGHIEAAVAVSLIMIVLALGVLTLARVYGLRSAGEGMVR